MNSGNSAIFTVMNNFQEKIMVPDQGGWSGFIKIAEFLGLELIYLPTDNGLIDPKQLIDILIKKKPEAFFLTSFAGYTAEQPIKEIYEVCDEEGVVLIEDASGALGDETGRLANGKHSHIIVASTGSPKIVNVGNGGLISSNLEEMLETSLKFLQADHVTCAGISQEIKHAPSTLSKAISSSSYLKDELENVFHKYYRGINVICKADNPNKLAKELRTVIKVHNGGMISKCPRYDRILENAVALEIKNLDICCLTSENLDGIIEIAKSAMKV
jgi:glycine/serine hydroxymethyltransferase